VINKRTIDTEQRIYLQALEDHKTAAQQMRPTSSTRSKPVIPQAKKTMPHAQPRRHIATSECMRRNMLSTQISSAGKQLADDAFQRGFSRAGEAQQFRQLRETLSPAMRSRGKSTAGACELIRRTEPFRSMHAGMKGFLAVSGRMKIPLMTWFGARYHSLCRPLDDLSPGETGLALSKRFRIKPGPTGIPTSKNVADTGK